MTLLDETDVRWPVKVVAVLLLPLALVFAGFAFLFILFIELVGVLLDGVRGWVLK